MKKHFNHYLKREPKKFPFFLSINTSFYWTIFKIIFITVLPVILLTLPSNFFDTGESICLSKLLLQTECYACGLTRGMMHLIHLNFEEAWDYNLLSFIVFPLLSIIWVQWFLKEIRIFKKMRKLLKTESN